MTDLKGINIRPSDNDKGTIGLILLVQTEKPSDTRQKSLVGEIFMIFWTLYFTSRTPGIWT
jgi:hypothetical protein